MAHWSNEYLERLSKRLTQRLRYAPPEQAFIEHEAGISFTECCRICNWYCQADVWYVLQHSQRSSGARRFLITYSRGEYYIRCPAPGRQHVPEVFGSTNLSDQRNDYGNWNICLDDSSGPASDLARCPAPSRQHVPEGFGSTNLSDQRNDYGNWNICPDDSSGLASDVASIHPAASNLLDFLEAAFSWLYQQIHLPDVVALQTFVANWRQVSLYHARVSPDPDRQQCLRFIEDNILSLQLAFLPPHSFARVTNHCRRDAVDMVWGSYDLETYLEASGINNYHASWVFYSWWDIREIFRLGRVNAGKQEKS